MVRILSTFIYFSAVFKDLSYCAAIAQIAVIIGVPIVLNSTVVSALWVDVYSVKYGGNVQDN